MSDWEKLQRIARMHKALAELSDAIIEQQTTISIHPEKKLKHAEQSVKETYFDLQDIWRF